MSFRSVDAALRVDGLPWCLKGPLVALAHFQNSKTGRTNPAIATIAKTAGVRFRTAIRAVCVFNDAGWLTIKSGQAAGRASTYTLHVEKWASESVGLVMEAYRRALVAKGSARVAKAGCASVADRICSSQSGKESGLKQGELVHPVEGVESLGAINGEEKKLGLEGQEKAEAVLDLGPAKAGRDGEVPETNRKGWRVIHRGFNGD